MLKFSTLLGAAFVLIAVAVHQRILASLDLALMRAAKSGTSPIIDVVGGILTYVAAAEVSVTLGIVAAIGLRATGVRGWAVAAPLLFLVTVPIELSLKFALNQPVPSGDLYRESIRYVLLGLPTMQSFPSGHSIRAMFFAILGTYLALRWTGRRGAAAVAVLWLLVLIASGWTRVYLGHHWPFDVIGGWLFGAAIGVCSVAIVHRTRQLT